ncbi:hypothetical protein [Castellaniella sp.]|uniref:hypothetical protein n=1 Tax=Castellaniella sp. TaxID=1955812 RepID=UPI002AFFACA7|nr:hypothetical protein [Castellaniella sp.]
MSETTKAGVAARMAGLEKQLAAHGQDPKYLEQMLGRMAVEKAQSLDDGEINRVFGNTVLSGFCVRYMQVARECGVTLADVYPELEEKAVVAGGAPDPSELEGDQALLAGSDAQGAQPEDDGPSPM